MKLLLHHFPFKSVLFFLFTGSVCVSQTVNPVSSQTVCNGGTVSAINFSGSGTTYSWTNSASSIGLAASGTGNIASFTGLNTGNAPVTANLTVVPGMTAMVVYTQTFNYTGSISNFTVPAGVTSLSITASGAQGGDISGSDGNASGGRGLKVLTTINVTPGHVLNILVGQQPPSATNASGGGGGTFIWNTSAANALLVAAGGGGGAAVTAFGCNCPQAGGDAGWATSGSNGTGGLGGAGTGGNGGGAVPGAENNVYGGGGAGWLSNGIAASTNGACAQTGAASKTPLNGGTGGTSSGGPWGASVNGYGGFGGGGGATGFCGGQGGGGGGGGYSGGAGGNYTSSPNASFGGGAGGSYSSGSVTGVASGSGHGQLIIQYTAPGIVTGTPANFTITVLPTPTVNAISSQTVCSGSAASAINFTGGVSNTSYSWANNLGSIGLAASGTGNIPSFLTTNAGTTTLVATLTVSPTYTPGGFACAGNPQQFSITVKPTPTGNATPTATTLCSGQGHTISLGSSIPGSTYAWNVVLISGSVGATGPFSGTSSVITNTFSGNAVFTQTIVASYNGCQSPVFSSSVTLNPLPTVSSSASNPVICLGNSTTLSGSGTASSYTWTGGVTNGVAFSPTVTATYTVTGTSSNGCSRTATRIVTVNPLPVVAVNSGSICAGQVFTMTPSGATTYTYSSPGNTVSPSVGISSYSVTGTDANGCVSSTAAISSLTVQALPVIAVNSGSICSAQTFTMNPSGALSYTYSGGSNAVSPPVGTSTFSVTGTNASGCVSATPAVSSVTVHPLPTLSVNSGSICPGNTFTITPSGAFSYTISGGSATVSPGTTTTYSITGTDLQGCMAAGPVMSTVSVHASPTISFTSSTATICTGNNTVLTPAGANSYTLQPGGLTGSSFTLNPSSTTTYSLTGTSLQNCPSANTPTAQVTVNTTPTISIAPLTTTICSGNSTVLTPGGANTYTLQPGALTGSSFTLSPSSTTTYSLSGMSLQNCPSVNTPTAQVTVNITPTISIAPGTATICSGNSIVLSPGGANTYTLEPGALTGSSFTLSPSSTTTYSLSGMSLQNCPSVNTPTAQVTVNITPTISLAPVTTTICSGNSTVLTPGGAMTYTLQPGALTGSSFTLSPSSTTTYSLTGMSLQNCPSVNTPTAQVTVNTTPTISIAPTTASICPGNSAVLSAGGANTYTLQPGALTGSSFTLSPSSTTTYSLSGMSLQNCPSVNTPTAQVTVNITPTISIAPLTTTICSGNSTVLTPGGAHTYTLQPGALTGSSFTLSPSSTTTYSLSGASLQNCPSVNTPTAQVTVNITPTISIVPGTAIICSGNSTVLTPGGANTYTLQPGALTGSSFTLSPSSTTTYSLTGTSLQNCPSANTPSTQVTVNTTPTVTAVRSSSAICAGASATLTASGANTYSWNTGATTNTIVVSPASSSTYTVNGMVSAGCNSNATVSIVVNANPTPSITASQASVCTGQTSTLTASGATTYTWSTGSNATSISPTPVVATTYTVTGSNPSGCKNSATQTIGLFPAPSINLINIGSLSASVCAGSSATLIATGVNSYTWNTGSNSTGIIVTPTAATSYSVNGTDLNGCAASSSITIGISARPIVTAVASNTGVCSGFPSDLTASGASTYTWNTGSTGANLSVSPTSTTVYTVAGTNNSGCTDTAMVHVTVYASPTVSIGADIEVAAGTDYQFNPAQSGATSYTWSPASYLSSGSILNPVVRPESDVTYILVAGSVNGCTASDTVVVKVLTDLVIANYMSPNGDGQNDTWKVSVPGLIRDYSVVIIDSYGKTVFSTANHYNNEFDGKLGGQDLPDGVYYYFIKDGNTTKFKGSITLTK